jgi:hypothetical protein
MGDPIDNCIETLVRLQNAGHKLILYTMRAGERLVEAVEYLEENGIKLYAVNENPTQKHWTTSPKIFCNLYIDDTALGCPLVNMSAVVGSRSHVDWYEVEEILQVRGVL